MPSHKVPTSQCPHCGHQLDRATNGDGEETQPSTGDATICLHCAGVMVFGDDLIPHAINELELDAMDDTTKQALARAQRLVVQFIASTKQKDPE